MEEEGEGDIPHICLVYRGRGGGGGEGTYLIPIGCTQGIVS